jgi:hypothetical protein
LFYRMPARAVEENWICDALNAALLNGFDRAELGQDAASWPECLREEYREGLKRQRKLGESVLTVLSCYRRLAPAERSVVREACEDQLQLAALYDGARAARTSAQLPAGIRASLKEFADRVFETVNDLGVRERSYAIHDAQNRLACAFCGYEAADGSLVRTMDWDHYLAKSLYPFAGANLRNFAPMGDACNSSFKSAKDMLRDHAGVRRRCFDPYVSEPATIDLLESSLFARGPGNRFPEWIVSITGDADRCETWDSVFAVRKRWIAKLDQIHDGCLKCFGHLYSGDSLTDAQLISRISRLANAKVYDGIVAGGFLPAAVYALWAHRLAAGGGRGGAPAPSSSPLYGTTDDGD